MTSSDIIRRLKSCIVSQISVTYDGSKYIPVSIVYWYDKAQNNWQYSVELIDVTQSNTTIRVALNKIVF